MRRRQSPARTLGVKSQELLTKCEGFQDKFLAGTKSTDKLASEVPEPHPIMGKILSNRRLSNVSLTHCVSKSLKPTTQVGR